MKILAWSDIHGNIDGLNLLLEKKLDYDVFVVPGDITVFSKDLDLMLMLLSKFKNVVIIHGNHEDVFDVSQYKTMHFIHNSYFDYGEYRFIGIGGGGFSLTSPSIEKVKKLVVRHKKIIFVTHAPPYNTSLDFLFGRHVGNMEFRKFIIKFKPIIALSGHLHENAGIIDYIDDTLLVNVAIPCLIDVKKKEIKFLNDVIE